jgi:hypothetical protein
LKKPLREMDFCLVNSFKVANIVIVLTVEWCRRSTVLPRIMFLCVTNEDYRITPAVFEISLMTLLRKQFTSFTILCLFKVDLYIGISFNFFICSFECTWVQ